MFEGRQRILMQRLKRMSGQTDISDLEYSYVD